MNLAKSRLRPSPAVFPGDSSQRQAVFVASNMGDFVRGVPAGGA